MSELPSDRSVFDTYAADYDRALEQGISVSGEDKLYFASGRLTVLATRLAKLGAKPSAIMDYGCGTGTSTPFMFKTLNATSVIGVDSSRESLHIADKNHGSNAAAFFLLNEYEPKQELDLVFTTGVFHHIPPSERPGALDYIYRSLKPGGIFAFWENNPWNLGTQYVMSRIPFDRDAVKVSVREAHRLLKESDFEILSTDFAFIFPGILSWLRPIEAKVSSLPLGAQYQVLCRRR